MFVIVLDRTRHDCNRGYALFSINFKVEKLSGLKLRKKLLRPILMEIRLKGCRHMQYSENNYQVNCIGIGKN